MRYHFGPLIGLTFICALAGLQVHASAAAGPALLTNAPEETSPSEAFRPLKQRFQRLFRSLDAQGGIADEDEPAIREVRRQIRAFNDEHPEYTPAIAAELQLSRWLQDHEVVDALYERLVMLNPDRHEYAASWVGYFRDIGERDRADEIFDTIIREQPGNVVLAMDRARQLKRRNEYPRAITILQNADPDPAEHPRAVILLAECLFADNRFEDAIAALNSIPESVLAGNDIMRTDVTQKRDTYEEILELWEQEMAIRDAEASADDLPRVRLVTTHGDIIVELFEDHAPNTVANFITLVEAGFYDGTRFHRVIPEFMAQGGDPNSRPGADGEAGQGGPGYRIPDEHDGEDIRMHFAGSLSMANTGAPNSGGSQFFFTHQPTQWLNGRHTVFGRVLEGLDIVRRIERDDLLITTDVLRKRDHDYEFEKVEEEEEVHMPDIDLGDSPLR